MRRREWRGDSDELVSEVERQKEVKGRCVDDPFCGPIITGVLRETLRKIDRFWGREDTDQAQKEAGCSALTGTGGWKAWDMIELKEKCPDITGPYPSCAIGEPCEGTAEVTGKCYRCHTVNYVTIGHIWRLCVDDVWHLDTSTGWYRLLRAIALWKSFSDLVSLEWSFSAAKAWAHTGYWQFPGFAAPREDRPMCESCRQTWDIRPSFVVKWTPFPDLW